MYCVVYYYCDWIQLDKYLHHPLNLIWVMINHISWTTRSECRVKEEVDGNPGRPVQIRTIDGTDSERF